MTKTEDPALEGVSFDVKYLGSTLVETPSGEGATAEAIKTVITMAKVSGKKLQRVTLTVGLQGIRMVDTATEEIHLEVSIYRISYCSADANFDHVFAFIATNSNETMECHAFLCPKRKVAQAVTLTIAQSFNMAYELWQIGQEKQKLPSKSDSPTITTQADTHNEDDADKPGTHERNQSLLIDLSAETPTSEPAWVCFEDDDFENMNNSFARLAASRSSGSSGVGTTVTSPVVVALSPPPRPLDNTPTSPTTSNPWNEPAAQQPIDLLCS
ncbi:hypothetical protein B566_EDAN007813 [Ephemera danica]|nr:hypothetical protein B566_EDAN007813 [Ephemera danica]